MVDKPLIQIVDENGPLGAGFPVCREKIIKLTKAGRIIGQGPAKGYCNLGIVYTQNVETGEIRDYDPVDYES
jgi:hypothetical protein